MIRMYLLIDFVYSLFAFLDRFTFTLRNRNRCKCFSIRMFTLLNIYFYIYICYLHNCHFSNFIRCATVACDAAVDDDDVLVSHSAFGPYGNCVYLSPVYCSIVCSQFKHIIAQRVREKKSITCLIADEWMARKQQSLPIYKSITWRMTSIRPPLSLSLSTSTSRRLPPPPLFPSLRFFHNLIFLLLC